MPLNNIATRPDMTTLGAALSNNGTFTSEYGIFDGTNWSGLTNIPLEDDNNRDTTIKVVNGALIMQP